MLINNMKQVSIKKYLYKVKVIKDKKQGDYKAYSENI